MNLLGIDFEDWFHPQLIQETLTDEKRIPSVIKGMDKIIDLLQKHDTFATFFMVGELLEFQPDLIDKILENGHEIGFHTMTHKKPDLMVPEEFTIELEEFAKLTNKKSKGFRAPTFALNEKSSWVIDLLEEYNYLYDSSIVPAKSSMYGNPNASKSPYKISSASLESNDSVSKITEFPLMVTKFLGKTIPAGGGFYLRTLPMSVTKKAIIEYEKKKIPGVFYIHSWELTPEFMPKIKLSTKNNFITYHNLDKAVIRMDELLSSFQFTSFERYIQEKK